MAGIGKAFWWGLALSLGGGVAFCGESDALEGSQVLREFLREVSLASDERVVGMTGFHAAPHPAEWLILVGTASEEKSYREFVFDGVRILGQRSLTALPGQDFPVLAIQPDRVHIASDKAYGIAAALVAEEGAKVNGAHLQLRVREEDTEPVWMLRLLGPGRSEAGLVYLSAETGEVLRRSRREGQANARDKVSVR